MLGPGGERSETVRHPTGEVERILLTPHGPKSPVRGEARRLSMLDPGTGCRRTYADAPAAAGDWRKAGGETVAGHSTTKFVLEAPDRRLTVWRAPALVCFELQTPLEIKDRSDPSMTVSTRLAPSERVAPGIAAGAFTIPADFVESKPSGVALDSFRFQLKRGGKTDAEADVLARAAAAKQAKALAADDARYLAQKP